MFTVCGNLPRRGFQDNAGPDLLARVIGQGVAASTSQTVVVENKAGANAIIGTDSVAKSAPDGYNLLVIDRLALITNPALYSGIPYNWQTDLKAVTELARVQLYLVVSGKLPAKNLAEFVAHVRANPGKLSYGTTGNGHINHIAMEALVKHFGLNLPAVPYKAFPPVIAGILNNEVISLITGPVPVLGMVRDGRLKALAVGSEKRTRELPDVPTIFEQGGTTAMLPPTVFVMMAQGGIPDALVTRINATVTAAMRQPEVVSAIEKQALELVPGSAADAARHMRDIAPGFLQAIKDAGVKIE